jgi:hypothetical protein
MSTNNLLGGYIKLGNVFLSVSLSLLGMFSKHVPAAKKNRWTRSFLWGPTGIKGKFFYPHFYLQTVQMQVHLANSVMGGEAGGGAWTGD